MDNFAERWGTTVYQRDDRIWEVLKPDGSVRMTLLGLFPDRVGEYVKHATAFRAPVVQNRSLFAVMRRPIVGKLVSVRAREPIRMQLLPQIPAALLVAEQVVDGKSHGKAFGGRFDASCSLDILSWAARLDCSVTTQHEPF
jgi:hypothetical protein